jgi:hypothetical protein
VLLFTSQGKIPEEAAAEVEGLPGADYVTLVAKANEPETVEENGEEDFMFGISVLLLLL